MKIMIASIISMLILTLMLTGRPWENETVLQESRQKPLVIFLVRHAEKVKNSKDPKLSKAGHKRAETLAKILRSAEIEYIHSSDYIRTRDTAAPVAKTLGLDVDLYNPRDLPAMAEKLLNSSGRHLVVGHSNTTPNLVELLGGEAGGDINEKSEYDRLYILTIAGDGSVSSVMMRFGDPYLPK